MSLFTLIFKPVLKKAARHALVGRRRDNLHPDKNRFTRADADQILRDAWLSFARMEPEIPPEPTVGSRMAVRLADLTVATFQVLMEKGVAREYAIQLVSDINWGVYGRSVKPPGILAAAVTRDRVRRMRIVVNLMMGVFPFNPPGYKIEKQSSDNGAAFDVFRCPVADRMSATLPAQDAKDLCVASWCNQDYAAAEIWGGWLERTSTLAGGADRCDFQILAKG